MKNKDVLRRLKATNPIDETTVDGPDSSAARELLNKIISTSPGHAPVSRHGRQTLRLAVVLGVGAAIIGAATWLVIRSIDTPTAVGCYQAAQLDADIAEAPAGGEATSEACVPVWRDGILTNTQIVPEGSVPPLTACVSDNGTLAVFPSDDGALCSRLGLAHADPATQPDADRVRNLHERLVEFFQSEGCMPMEVAEPEVRRLLDEASFEEWTILSEPTTTANPCASHSVDPPNETVHLVPIPDL